MNIQRCVSLAAGAKVFTVESVFLCQILKRWIPASDSEVCICGVWLQETARIRVLVYYILAKMVVKSLSLMFVYYGAYV